MPAPLDPAKREAIEADVRAGVLSRNKIARAHGVGTATVSRIAAALVEAGEGPGFDRTSTEAATRAAQVDNAARRAALEAELLKVAQEELARRDSPVTWGNFGGRDNEYNEVELDAPTFAMRSTLVTTAARAIKAAADLASVAGGNPNERTRSLLEALADTEPAEPEAAA